MRGKSNILKFATSRRFSSSEEWTPPHKIDLLFAATDGNKFSQVDHFINDDNCC